MADYQIIDRATGDVLLAVIHLWPRDVDVCPLCEQVAVINRAVAFYCEPTHDPIGSVSTEYTSSDGSPAIVGGMSCCKDCHDRHYGVDPNG